MGAFFMHLLNDNVRKTTIRLKEQLYSISYYYAIKRI